MISGTDVVHRFLIYLQKDKLHAEIDALEREIFFAGHLSLYLSWQLVHSHHLHLKLLWTE